MKLFWGRRTDGGQRPGPPTPPLQPRIRSFMERRPPLFLVENGHARPFGWRRVSALYGDLPRVQLVEGAPGVHALQVEEVDFHLIPVAGEGRTLCALCAPADGA